MIKCRLKKCCLSCPHPEVETQRCLRRHVRKHPTTVTKIFCKHEPVCKMYDEETEALIDENTNSDE